jgi:hypothetical protein
VKRDPLVVHTIAAARSIRDEVSESRAKALEDRLSAVIAVARALVDDETRAAARGEVTHATMVLRAVLAAADAEVAR